MRSKIKNQKLASLQGRSGSKIKSIKGFSAIVVLVVMVVIILSLVAVIVLKGGNLQQKAIPSPTVAQDPQVKSLETLSNSDEVGAIDKDTNNTNLDNIDTGLDVVNKQVSGL